MNRYANRLPDFLMSLVPPVLLFAALDGILGTRYFSQPYWPSYYYALFFGAALASEQLMSVVSGWIFRGFILGLVLRYPSRNLFEHGSRGFFAILFPEYFAPMAREMAARIKAKFDREGIQGLEAQYLHAVARIQGRHDIHARIDSLASQSMFAQNLCLAAMITFLLSLVVHNNPAFPVFAGAALVLSFYRFLRAVRTHALELYLAYDYLQNDAAADRPARRELHAA